MTRLLSCPILVYNVDRSPNEASSITKVVNMVLQYWDHSEQAIFMVTSVGRQDIILGLTWLHKHNPEVDFKDLFTKPICSIYGIHRSHDYVKAIFMLSLKNWLEMISNINMVHIW